MQSVNAGTIQNQISPPNKKIASEKNQETVKTAADSQKGSSDNVSEDNVTLSASSIIQSSKNKKPSSPVSNEEKDALLKPAADGMRLSLYV